MSEKSKSLKQAKKKAKVKANMKKVARRERWADRFPFNMIRDMWHRITGEPR